MTEQIKNAISIIENEKKCVQSDCDRDCGKCELVKEESEIVGAFDLAIEALEKQIPQKPIIKTNAYNYKFYKCPNCMIDIKDVIFSPYVYCHKCSQKIDKEVSE